jgi:hypothetical protein
MREGEGYECYGQKTSDRNFVNFVPASNRSNNRRAAPSITTRERPEFTGSVTL